MKNENFERELPTGYKQVKYINAKDVKLGLIMNAAALIIGAVLITLAILPIIPSLTEPTVMLAFSSGLMIGALLLVIYMILHELVHGLAYKMLTGEKLTFGISWSCAFCGVPEIYTYRRCALVALLSPFILFSVLLLSLMGVFLAVFLISDMLALKCVAVSIYIAASLLFGVHAGGCSGDLYVTYLFVFKFRDKRTLIRDTGPEQYIYVPTEDVGDKALVGENKE